MPLKPPDGYVSVDDAVAVLGLHANTVRRLINTGEIPAINVGGEGRARRLYIERTALDEYGAARVRPAYVKAAS